MRTLGYGFVGVLVALSNFAAVSLIYDQPPPIALLFGVAIAILMGGMLVEAIATFTDQPQQPQQPTPRKRRRRAPKVQD